jgi:hypothetical protein
MAATHAAVGPRKLGSLGLGSQMVSKRMVIHINHQFVIHAMIDLGVFGPFLRYSKALVRAERNALLYNVCRDLDYQTLDQGFQGYDYD